MPAGVGGRNVGGNVLVRGLPKREEEVGRGYGAVAIGQIFEVNLAIGAASVGANGEEGLIELIAVRSSVRGIRELHAGGERPVEKGERGQDLGLAGRADDSTGGCARLHY